MAFFVPLSATVTDYHTYGMIYRNMARSKSGNKERRTFTLSPASLAYLDQETRRRNADSQSAVLDELLREKKRERQLAALEAAIGSYYDEVSDAEAEEEKIWGEFAGNHLTLKEDEPFYAQSIRDEPTARRNLVHETAHRPTRKRKASSSHRVGRRTKQSSAR
jgi:hypothetical protein